jgi:DNA polymerase-1
MPNQLPLFAPPVKWKAPEPADWPDFSGAEYLGLDTETEDPHLVKKGPGFIRGDASVIGVSLADENGRKIYLPIGHVEGNVADRDQAIRYVRDQLKRHDQKKVGANLHYDMESLWSLGVEVNGPLCDIQIAEPLLDEDKVGGYTLEALSAQYLGYGKREDELRRAAADYRVDPKKHMKYMPAGYVGEYAEADAENAVLIFMEQVEAMKADDVWGIFSEVEQPLQRVLFKMRLQGVRVDLDRAERLAKEARAKEERLYREIVSDAGFAVNVYSGNQVARYLLKKGISVPRTMPTANCPDGNYSVKDEWLQSVDDPAAGLIRSYRKTVKMRKDFIEGMILKNNVRGRVHSQWNQLRKSKDEDGGGDDTQGTRSGRIAAANENLTQIPARDPEWGPPIRSCYVGEVGQKWTKLDYSSQEPRIMLHFAYIMGLEGAAETRQKYIEDPSISFHKITQQIIIDRTGKDIGYRPAKDINLGRAYGMGVEKLARKLGVDREDAVEILRTYDQGVPFVSKLNDKCKARVEERGFITTILGRKRRFNTWEKRGSFGYGAHPPTDYDSAVRLWGKANVVRSGLNKALNALVQGSAGDQTKRAIVLMDAEGYLPLVQVYDEIGISLVDPRDMRRVQHIMEHAIDITIPVEAGPDCGPSWGEVKPLEDAA